MHVILECEKECKTTTYECVKKSMLKLYYYFFFAKKEKDYATLEESIKHTFILPHIFLCINICCLSNLTWNWAALLAAVHCLSAAVLCCVFSRTFFFIFAFFDGRPWTSLGQSWYRRHVHAQHSNCHMISSSLFFSRLQIVLCWAAHHLSAAAAAGGRVDISLREESTHSSESETVGKKN